MIKNKKNLNVPPLRFPDFEGEWEKKNFDNAVKHKKGKGLNRNSITKNGNPCILYGDLYTIYSENPIISDVNYFTNIKTKNFIYSKENDVIVPASGETSLDITAAACVKKAGIILGSDINILSPKDEVFGDFLTYQIRGIRKIDIAKITQGNSVVHLNYPQFKKINFFFPNMNEQKKIAKFLSLIDKRIEVQRKLIENYKSLIKVLENQLLNNKSWHWKDLKQLVIDKIIVLKRGDVIPKSQYSKKNIYPVYSSSVNNNGLMGFHYSYMFNCEMVSWSIDGGGTFFYRHNHKFNITNVSGYINILDTNKYIYGFIYQILNLQHSKMKFDYQTKAHPSIIDTLYFLPNASLEEQEKIWTIFKKTYFIITKNERILNKIKNSKSYLLSNLFM